MEELEEPTFDPFEQPPLVQALLVALHTLVVHNSMQVTSEGETWTLNFMPQISKSKLRWLRPASMQTNRCSRRSSGPMILSSHGCVGPHARDAAWAPLLRS
jgi:hypothetical protein